MNFREPVTYPGDRLSVVCAVLACILRALQPSLVEDAVKLPDLLLVIAGAGVGGGLRYAAGGWMAMRMNSGFPWHTFVINVLGAFLLGVLMAVPDGGWLSTTHARLLLGVGVLGGFTTFSTLSYESVELIQQGLVAQGMANMFGSGVAGIAAAVAGMLVGRAV